MKKKCFLLDTHALIWFFAGTNQLPKKVVEEICNFDNKISVSIASFWELAIKINLKKIELSHSLETMIKRCEYEQIEILSLKKEHILKLEKLNNYHRDPFDRIIISQAITEKLTVISQDCQFSNYPVKMFW
jgi:PIN domain nuclease of toxin-antitoxin system